MEEYLNAFGLEAVVDEQIPDTSETVHISALALLKMLKHGRAGVPLEVMGLMLGEFTDDYNIKVVDVFSMPQIATGITVEAVDPIFQTEMLNILKTTGRIESVVGWYHSHPGFGCYLSSTDVSTQSAFEKLNKRSVAVVVDPIQSVKGKVEIDAFRNIQHLSFEEPRTTTSNIGYLKQPTFVSLVHGLNQKYYSFDINFVKSNLDCLMLLNLHKKSWAVTLTPLEIVENKTVELLSCCLQQKSEIYNTNCNPTSKFSGTQIGVVNYEKQLSTQLSVEKKNIVFNRLLFSIFNYIFE